MDDIDRELVEYIKHVHHCYTRFVVHNGDAMIISSSPLAYTIVKENSTVGLVKSKIKECLKGYTVCQQCNKKYTIYCNICRHIYCSTCDIRITPTNTKPCPICLISLAYNAKHNVAIHDWSRY